jgi:hypothetical protein
MVGSCYERVRHRLRDGRRRGVYQTNWNVSKVTARVKDRQCRQFVRLWV